MLAFATEHDGAHTGVLVQCFEMLPHFLPGFEGKGVGLGRAVEAEVGDVVGDGETEMGHIG